MKFCWVHVWRNGDPLLRYALCLFVLLCFAARANAQTTDFERPVPVLTGNTGFFNKVTAGRNQLVPEINPVLLVPLGDRWLIESRAEFSGEFEQSTAGGAYESSASQELDYAQLDYIANRYVTVTLGRFLTPFGIYNERLYPIWIRDLHQIPLIFPIGTGSSNGAMLRGGFSLNPKINLNYAAYFSALSTLDKFDSDRTGGGRLGIFLPGPRIEVGGSWQKSLQELRTNSFGFHFAWQPAPLPLNLRSEYARSNFGSGYWIEAAYRLSQIPVWNQVMRQTEFVSRMQQTFAGEVPPPSDDEYSFPRANTRQPDFGLNYYIRDGLKVSGSYGRWLSGRNYNVWTMGIAYRFAFPLGRSEAR